MKMSENNVSKSAGSHRGRRAWVVIALMILIAAAAVYFLMRPKTRVAPLPVVEVETVSTSDVNIYGEYVGRIRAQQFVEIHARVEGYLQKMCFKEGTYIKAGQTLFVIDPQLYQAHVNKARAQLNKAEAQARKARHDLDRIRPLYEQNAASQLDLDNAVAAYEGAQAEVIVSRADLTQAELTLGYTRVT
ncbi:MAG: efflux RND transporter periplasmic adaptor subunit, partial [Muribaculaceae bacterium]|nr:efflux RND transporter periplasmic adaptor subunit [Muribaculaceae bacterium]